MQFAHLRVHTEYSLVDGTIRIQNNGGEAESCATGLMSEASELGISALAITDRHSLFAATNLQQGASQSSIKLIVGSDLWIKQDADSEKWERITLLAMDIVGYRNLMALLVAARENDPTHEAVFITPANLANCSAGLIALSGRNGGVNQAALAGRMVEAAERLENLHALFPGRLYLEISRCGRDGDEVWVTAAMALSQQSQVPVVATNDVRFLERSDFLAHEVRVCIVRGQELQDQTRDRDFTEEQHLKSAEEMAALFADIPEAIANSLEIAGRCTLSPEIMDQDLAPDAVTLMTARMVIRDVSRVLGHTYDYGDLIARRIPMHKEITIPKAISQDPKLQHDIEKDLELRSIITVGMALEGIAR